MRTGCVVVGGGVVITGDVVVGDVVVRSTVVLGAVEVFRMDDPANIQIRPPITKAAIRPGIR